MTERYAEAIQSMPKLSDFDYWFRWTKNGLEVVDCSVWKRTGFITANCDEVDDKGVRRDFELFKRRPEYLLGCRYEGVPSQAAPNDVINDIIFTYEFTLLGAILARNENRSKDRDQFVLTDNLVPKFEGCVEWLESTDFFTAPASSRYHDAFKGGLLCHCMNVKNSIVELWNTQLFGSDVTLDSAVLCALVHDWCKIGLYDMYMRNVKNDETGQWEQVPNYKYVDKQAFTLGHGVSSMYLAGRFIRLSMEESLAIRWHMGRWQVGACEEAELQQSNQRYPLVYMLQFADQLACTDYANHIGN